MPWRLSDELRRELIELGVYGEYDAPTRSYVFYSRTTGRALYMGLDVIEEIDGVAPSDAVIRDYVLSGLRANDVSLTGTVKLDIGGEEVKPLAVKIRRRVVIKHRG